MEPKKSGALDALIGGWHWRGGERPPFAIEPKAGQESVWDYPRPPAMVADAREVVIHWGEVEVARSRNAIRVLETAHPPSFYLPWEDVAGHLLHPGTGASVCEWKGPARYWSLVENGRTLHNIGWSYPQPSARAASLSGCIAFYPAPLECRVAGALVSPQPGGFYGGWITPEVVGPFKGDRGTMGW